MSFQRAALPSNSPLSSEGVSLASSTMTVSAMIPMRSRATPTRSRANRGCPGALVNGDHAVDTSCSCRPWAAAMIGMAMMGSSSAPVVHRIQQKSRILRMGRERLQIWCLRCLLLVMHMHPFSKEALTLHLARSEGHERYFGCNLMHRRVLVSSHQHLMAEAPSSEAIECKKPSVCR